MSKRLAVALLICLLSSNVRAEECYKPVRHLVQGTLDYPNQQNLIILALGSVATVSVLSLDISTRDYFRGKNRLKGWEVVGNFWGSGIPGVLIGGGTLGYGLAMDDSFYTNAGEANLEGLAAGATYTELLKQIFYRERPGVGDHKSFPSGHTSTAFATAANMMDMYGPTLGIPALGMGVLTAVSRMASNKHWLSDTVFGATLGYTVGHAYSLHHLSAAQTPTTSVMVIPYFENRREFGLIARLGF